MHCRKFFGKLSPGCRLLGCNRVLSFSREAIIFRGHRRLAAFPRTSEAAVLVSMELSRIIISDLTEQQMLYLQEIEGPRTFPILIGLFEAASIKRHVKG